eukprot:scaffold32509_cov37-Phaeocystis_antarctica.AAC.1
MYSVIFSAANGSRGNRSFSGLQSISTLITAAAPALVALAAALAAASTLAAAVTAAAAADADAAVTAAATSAVASVSAASSHATAFVGSLARMYQQIPQIPKCASTVPMTIGKAPCAKATCAKAMTSRGMHTSTMGKVWVLGKLVEAKAPRWTAAAPGTTPGHTPAPLSIPPRLGGDAALLPVGTSAVPG